MSVPRYRYRHNGHGGTLVLGQDNKPYRFQCEDGRVYPLAPDDLIQLDAPNAAFLAQADALVEAWRELCQAAADLPDPEAVRPTLLGCLDAMQRIARYAERLCLQTVHKAAALNPVRPRPRRTWRAAP